MTDPITPLDPQQTAKEEAQTAKEGYLRRLPVAIDIFADEVADGPMDETISSRAARASRKGKWWGRLLSKFLNLFQKDHGADAQAGDVERAQNVLNLENSSGDLNQPNQEKNP